MIDVHFEDSSTKKFVITEETTVAELVKKINQKMHLSYDLDSFALFESYTVGGKIMGIVPRLFYCTLLCFFPSFSFLASYLDRYLKPTDLCPRVSAPNFLLYKKRFFYQDNVDPGVVHMEFIQVFSLIVTFNLAHSFFLHLPFSDT